MKRPVEAMERPVEADRVWPETLQEQSVLSGLHNAIRSLRQSERVAIAYFLYTAILASLRSAVSAQIAVAWLLPFALAAIAASETRFSRGWSRVTRDWAALGLILIAYWQLDWFVSPHLVGWQEVWIIWDRALLDQWSLRAALESFGWIVPWTLEGVYLLLYAIPPICMGALYICGRRRAIDRFLTTLFLGTFCSYALLPLFPIASPHVAFPGADTPNYTSIWRGVNVWLLEHMDIRTGVFPSGHVAVAFSAAFGMFRAMRDKRWIWSSVFAAALIVLTATIYGRYHYLPDGIASIGISIFAWRASKAFNRDV
jgi:hypothetical protein